MCMLQSAVLAILGAEKGDYLMACIYVYGGLLSIIQGSFNLVLQSAESN